MSIQIGPSPQQIVRIIKNIDWLVCALCLSVIAAFWGFILLTSLVFALPLTGGH